MPASKTTRRTGMGGHQSAASQSDIWLTPPPIIEALGGVDSFDLDPCSPASRPWRTARHHYTEADNGLIQPWAGRVWLNPPYSYPLIERFMRRLAEHDHGIALIFARTETDVFHRHVWPKATGLLFLDGRIHFHLPDGRRATANAGAPSVLVAYGDEDRDILAAAPIDGHFLPNRLPVSLVVCALEQSWREALVSWFSARTEPATLSDIYRAFARHPKTRSNPNWRPKLRQTLQHGPFDRVVRGQWQRRAA